MADRAEHHPDIVPAEYASLYLSAIRRCWWVVVGAAMITAVLSFAFSASQPKRYEATAKVLLTNTEPVNVLLHSTSAPSPDPERDLNTDVALVKLDAVARRVRTQLSLSLSTTKLLREVHVTPQGTSNLVGISALDRSPELAAAIANAFATGYISSRTQQARASYAAAARLARTELAGLDPVQRRGEQGAALRAQLRQLDTAGALQTGGALLVDPAAVPTTAATPRPKFAAAVGGFIGLLLGVLAAIAAGADDRRRSAVAQAKAAAAANGRLSRDSALSEVAVPAPTSMRTVTVSHGEAARQGRLDD